MTPTLTSRDVVNWQTFLQIVRFLPANSQTPLISFTNPFDAASFMHQQDPPGKKLCLLTKDANLFWIVPIGVADQLLDMGFYQILNQYCL